MVAKDLHAALTDARRRGADFDTAWPAALEDALAGETDEAERDAWRAALQATRDAWHEAWERRPATRHERALAAVADDPDREALPARPCGRCGGPIPAGRDRRAKWCSDRCRRAVSNAREADRRAAERPLAA